MKLILSSNTPARISMADSISKGLDDDISSIMPVSMTEESSRLFNSAIFPPRGKPKNGKISVESYFALSRDIVAISNMLSFIQGSLRSILLRSSFKGDSLKEGLEQTQEQEMTSYIRAFINSVRDRNLHVVRPSTRYKGGFDILFTGIPPATSVLGPNVGPALFRKHRADAPWPSKGIDELSSSATGQCAVDAAQTMFDILFSGRDVSSQGYERMVVQLPLTFDWAGFARQVADVVGKYDPATGSALAATLSTFGVQQRHADLAEIVSIVVIREANRKEVASRLQEGGLQKYVTPKQELLLNSDITVSFALNLPQHVCEFITQTNDAPIPLVPLVTWATSWARACMRIPGAKVGGVRLTTRNAPRYVLPASKVDVVTAKRKALGYYCEPGRLGDDNLCVSPTGRLNWLPKAGEVSSANAKQYEALLETALKKSFDAGSPLAISKQGVTDDVFALASPDYAKDITALKSKLGNFTGSVQAVSWDYNCVLGISSYDPESLVATPIAGSVATSYNGIEQVLSGTALQALDIQFPNSTDRAKSENLVDFAYKFKGGSSLSSFTPFAAALDLYTYLLYDGKVPTLQELVKSAAAALGIKTLDIAVAGDEKDHPLQYELGLYKDIISDSLVVQDKYNADPKSFVAGELGARIQSMAIGSIFDKVLTDAAAVPGSNLLRVSYALRTDFESLDRYYDITHRPLHEISKVFQYLGGRIFADMLLAIASVKTDDLTILNTDNPVRIPDFHKISTMVMPLAVLLGKYAPNYESILEKAEAERELLTPDTSIGAEDIKLPGSSANFSVFPHQLGCNQTLRRRPKFAILDVAPGGGKTVILLADVGQLIGEGHVKRSCIICPDNLIKNWVEDMHKVTDGKWNIIPICRLTYISWGAERIEELITRAPKNTIFVIGMNFFRLQKYTVVLGNHAEMVSSALEFVRRFEFDYVAIDESHRTKNVRTVLHKAVRQLTTASCVKFVRKATGSLLSNKLTDIVGQSALLTPQIFRTADEYEAANQVMAPDGSGALVWAADAPMRARQQMSKYAAVMTYKRKHWAFLLPNPVQNFFAVQLTKEQLLDANGNKRDPIFVDEEIGNAHQALYEAVLREQLEQMTKDEELVRLLKMKKSSESGDGNDDADDDSGDDDNGDDSADLDGDLSEEMQSKLEALLEPYLQRLEQLLSDPMGDPLGKEAFQGIEQSRIVSNKVLLAIKRAKLNFDLNPWVKGNVYAYSGDFVDYEGVRYSIRESASRKLTDEEVSAGYRSILPPNKDTEVWAPETYGKVLIFCRYVRTVEAIYDALPPELKKIAFMFHGGCADRYDKLDAFKRDPYSRTSGMQICIAVEMAITEGHNLQMASRQVRMESPWAPSDLDQGSARIFRPDVSGKYKRENIYIDWILANGTMEVAKFARLISKIIVKAKFDEASNENYAPIQHYMLPTIRMGLDIFKSRPLLSDVVDYTDAYQHFDAIQRAEFSEMRASGPSSMISIPPTPMFEDSAVLEQVPYLPGMNLPDRHNYGLVGLNDYLNSEDPEIKSKLEKNGPVGLFVHTEHGNGIIEKVVAGRGSRDGTIIRIDMRLSSGDVYKAPPSMVWVATKLDRQTAAKFSPSKSIVTDRDRKRAERLDRATMRALELEERRQQRQAEKERKALDKLQGRRSRKETEEVDEHVNYVDVYPTIYNGYWALEAAAHEDCEVNLKDLGYRSFGDYAWIAVRDLKTLDAIRAFLNRRYVLDRSSAKRLSELDDSFSGRGGKFAADVHPYDTMKNFFRVAHTKSGVDEDTGKPILKIYPAVLNSGLLLKVDLATNPAFRKVIGKLIPGTTVAFDEADGIHIKFFATRSALSSEIKSLEQEGNVTVVNKDEALDIVKSFKIQNTR